MKIGVVVLNEMSKIHPFIAAPLLAFKLIITLDLKMMENDKKVGAVKAQMQDLICVIIEVCNHAKERQEGPTGLAIRLETLFKRIEHDIKLCGSDCDMYNQKSLLRKLIKSPKYEAFFAYYMSRFIEYRDELYRDLALHTALRMEDVNSKLDDQRFTLVDIQSQLKTLFRILDTPKEKEILRIIDGAGGAGACIENHKILQELVLRSEDDSFRKNHRNVSHKEVTNVGNEALSVKEKELPIQEIQRILRQELYEDLDKVFQENFGRFSGKLDIQAKAIKDTVERQSDRIISYVSGWHERITDPHIRAIWKEMGWRGNVKAVDFVFALRDYFSCPTEGLSQPLYQEQNGWTKRYIHVSNLQSISESIDDDGSGFININEVNQFILNCPKDWSILQWLAYWAAGWHVSVTQYKDKIYRLIIKMFSLLDKVKSANRTDLHFYLHDAGLRVAELLQSTKNRDSSKDDLELMKQMKQDLESVHYNLDSIPTVQLVCGPGRIEKHIYPLLYNLLQQHFKIFQLACDHILHREESSLSASETFKQMQIDPEIQFEKFAFGMFRASEMRIDPLNSTFESVHKNLTSDLHEDEHINNFPQDLNISILKYPVHQPYIPPAPTEQLGILEKIHMDTNGPFGYWTGFCANKDKFCFDGMLRIHLEEATPGDGNITGRAETYRGSLKITGTCTKADSRDFIVDLVMTYDEEKQWNYGHWTRCRGNYNAHYMSITGNWITHETGMKPGDPMPENSNNHFTFTRTPAELVRFKYSEQSFRKNPPRARWKFALDAITYDVQRKMMTKKFVFTTLQPILRLKRLEFISNLNGMCFSFRGRSEISDQDWDYGEYKDLSKNMPFYINRLIDAKSFFVVFRLPEQYIDETLTSFNWCLGCVDAKNPKPFKDYIHDTSHSLIRSEYPIHLFYLASVIEKAREVSERVKSDFRSNAEASTYNNDDHISTENIVNETTNDREAGNNSGEEEMSVVAKMCMYCENSIVLPCWIILEGEKFVCDTCYQKKLFPPLPHEAFLTPRSEYPIMLRIINSEKAKVVERDRLIRVEQKLERIEQKLEEHLSSNIQGKSKIVGFRRNSIPDTVAGNVAHGHSQAHSHVYGQQIEQRFSDVESKLSRLEGTLLDVLGALRDKKLS
ncbi:hypothetical protein BDQ17DRAFT_1412488 [Cyathus striatus]|nr:hypothetical protein BDQ17DRAFT_1412488 [Cyathus striatus]